MTRPASSPRASPGQDPVLDPPPEVREIARTLEQAGFEAWCVGGAVRDALLSLPHLDWDLATSATPPQVKRAFRRTVPVGEQFGTIGVLDRNGRLHEVTTFRRDVQTDGRHAVVEFGASLDEDLARRDFTINAIAYSPRLDELRDPFHGRDDLSRGVIRAVGTARERMVEDRLRALRALRFAGRFGFRIEPATWSAIAESAPFLPRLSRERVKQELEKTMEQVAQPSRALALWRTAGALRTLLPVLDAQPDYILRAADHIATPDATGSEGRKRRRTLLRLATLFVGVAHADATRALRDLRFSNRDIEWLSTLAVQASALRPALQAMLVDSGMPDDRVLRRWAADCGRLRLADTLRVALATLSADGAPGDGAPGDVRRAGAREASDDAPGETLHAGRSVRGRALYRRALRLAFRDPVEIADLVVDGEDLMREGGVARGPALGAALRRLRDLVVEDPARNSRADLLALARSWSVSDEGGR
ncbi:MAG: CCA tRNA nucleotidyltransferase [Gemmatimonadetes bacterium]|nr:CCA tRNA nucleotidyltransferase [Gemmatimonadota bacterium]MCC6773109.1 CCA tRNA nucleotidyltransferase [Gemmatimonadaceae bacterium]